MHVVELTARAVRVPLKREVRHASHVRTETDNVVVRVRLSDGSVGWGEGVPREYVTGESATTALDLLRSSDLKAQLGEARDYATALRVIEALRTAPVPGNDRGIAGNAARCAVEIALLDAYGKAFGEPLCNVAKTLAPELYQFREKVQYSGAITSARKGIKLRMASWRWRLFGVKHLKVKVGIEGHDDAYRLKFIRSRVGKGVEIRVDANEAWPASEAADRIAELEPARLVAVEQPVSHEEVSKLAEIRKRVKAPVMLDESLCGMVDAERAVAGGWCSQFNLRLSKCGGFIPALRLAQFAAKNGLGYQLGCQVGETAILSTAGRHFATSVKDLLAVEGSFDRHLVQYALGDEDVTFGWGGWAPALVRTGLGIGIQEEWVTRLATRTEQLIG